MLIRRSISSVHKGSHFEGNSSSTGRTLKRQRGTAARWLQFGEEIPACIPGAAVRGGLCPSAAISRVSQTRTERPPQGWPERQQPDCAHAAWGGPRQGRQGKRERHHVGLNGFPGLTLAGLETAGHLTEKTGSAWGRRLRGPRGNWPQQPGHLDTASCLPKKQVQVQRLFCTRAFLCPQFFCLLF